jgi:hypothetical protein
MKVMTIGFYVAAAIVAFVGILFGILVGVYDYEWGMGFGIILATIVLVGLILGYGYWYCNNTAGGARAMKDQQSELHNGLMREITITAEDGREIFYYKGKCDIETNGNYILFEDEQGLRQMIYWGITDTIIISELPN